MYEKIHSRRSVPELYEDKLIVSSSLRLLISCTKVVSAGYQFEKLLRQEDAANLRTEYKAHLDSQLSHVASYAPSASMLQDQWRGMVWPASNEAVRNPETGVGRDVLKQVANASVMVPERFVGLQSSKLTGCM